MIYFCWIKRSAAKRACEVSFYLILLYLFPVRWGGLGDRVVWPTRDDDAREVPRHGAPPHTL